MARLGYVEFYGEGSISITGNASGHDGTLEYSIDNGTWTNWDSINTIHGVNIKIRGQNNTMLTGPEGQGARYSWSIYGTNVSIKGYISDLLDYVNMPTAPLEHPAFASLFAWQDSIVNCGELIIDIAGHKACAYMFEDCTSLTTAPELIAMVVGEFCCKCMFQGCKSLTTAPKILATILAEGCYSAMFQGCKSLTTISGLPAMTLESNCYDGMFQDCTSLKISETQDEEYKYPIIFAPEGATTTSSTWNRNMLFNTGGTFTDNPQIGVTYYTTHKHIEPEPEPQSKFLYNGKAGTLYYNGKKEKGYYNGTQIQ